MRYNRPAQIDKNQGEIVKVYRSLGALVLFTHTLKNCCDLIITYRGQTHYVEIKDPKSAEFPQYFYGLLFEQREEFIINKHLTDGELKFREDVLARGGIYSIVYDNPSVLRSLKLKTK